MLQINRFLILGLIAVIGLVWNNIGFAQENNYQIGESSGKLLEFAAGVRPSGMGGAFVGLADDVSAVFWNPAGLSQVIGREVSLGHTSLYTLISVESLAYSQPVLGGVGAIAINYANYGPVEQYTLDEYFNPIPLNSSVTPHAIFGRFAWSKSITKYFALGLLVKGMQENYGVESKMMAAMDAGAYYVTGIEGLNLGACVQNLQMPFVERTLPILTRVGMSYALPWTFFLTDRFTAAVDLNLPTVSAVNTSIGLEYWCQDWFALRAGYNFSELNQYDRLLGFSAGASVKLFFVELDYAFLPNSEIGDTHRVSLLARFATDLEKAEQAKREKKPTEKINSGPKRYFYQYLFSTE